jgi:hypothetical protein
VGGAWLLGAGEVGDVADGAPCDGADWLADGDAWAEDRSHSGNRPAVALATSAAAKATAINAMPSRTQDDDLRNGLPLREPAAAAGPSHRM